MKNNENSFEVVCGRLKFVLDITSDLQLAKALGIAQTALANRKTRGSLPIEHIDAVIQREGLNPEFIYEGTGPVHLDVDVESWEAGFRKRLKQMLSVGTYSGVLVSQGHAAKVLTAVASGKDEPAPRLLRDMQKHLGIDLNWLVVGDTSTQHTKDEDALLTLYRKASAEGKAFINQAAGMAKTQHADLAHQANQVMDVAKGKPRPGGKATFADGTGVRVPATKPRPAPKRTAAAQLKPHTLQIFHGEVSGGAAARDIVNYLGSSKPTPAKRGRK